LRDGDSVLVNPIPSDSPARGNVRVFGLRVLFFEDSGFVQMGFLQNPGVMLGHQQGVRTETQSDTKAGGVEIDGGINTGLAAYLVQPKKSS
jgi:hypothetical protein